MSSLDNQDDIDQSLIDSNKNGCSKVAVVSFLNLTFLPVISFVWLLIQYRHCRTGQYAKDSLLEHHIQFEIKLNLVAAFLLIFVTFLMIFLGGFNSPWTWVYVISYFTLVHSIFILISVWAITRVWSNKTVTEKRD